MFQLRSIDSSDATANGTQQYSQLLLAEKAQVRFELRRRLESLHSGPVAVEDQAPILHEQFVSIRHNNVAFEKMKAIDGALTRLERGEYGICEECDEPISEKRLKAVPWARYCLHCQENVASDNGSLAFQYRKAA